MKLTAIDMLPWLAIDHENGEAPELLTYDRLVTLPDPYPLLLMAQIEQWHEASPEALHWLPSGLRVHVQDACKQMLRKWRYGGHGGTG